ncbi:hypothetical protein [Brucella sp. JSBI001]|uniref:hypothetical protein n=1 Tax=Brucella sp. JSBI001 TaxID=2886044 RepID=UPI0022321A0A|nr:hypothetical protein [Brucella sp. JSBI001]UZD70871.1 hypothetical protein LJ361_05470 [Brucella sp. JSBI001]
MTKKAKGPVEAATSPSQRSNPSKGIKNMQVDITGAPKTPEHPSERVRRLALELSEALNDVDGYHMATIFPSAAHCFPVIFCIHETYAQQMKALYAYRDAWNVLKPLKPSSQAYKDAKQIFRDAEWALQDSFDGEDA